MRLTRFLSPSPARVAPVNLEDLERDLRAKLDALGPPVRAELLRTLLTRRSVASPSLFYAAAASSRLFASGTIELPASER